MNFITPCFVRVEDAEERKELIEWATSIGYEVISRSGTAVNARGSLGVIGAYAHDGNTAAVAAIQSGCYDCGIKIDLFKALASMNDENDREQWFYCLRTDDASPYFIKSPHDRFDPYRLCWTDIAMKRKATAKEIVEHFKNQ